MIRTVVLLEEDDRRWLEKRAKSEGVPMTELIRRAVCLLRQQSPGTRPALSELLERTAGVWKHGDGLKYQMKARRE